MSTQERLDDVNSSNKNVEFCEGLEKIDEGAFEDCLALESIKLPNSVKCIGDRAFFKCKNLKKVRFGTGLLSGLSLLHTAHP